MEERKPRGFTSRMTTLERAAALGYIPVHVYLLPKALGALPFLRALDTVTINVIYYAIGTAFMLCFLWRFLRREFDALCDYGPAALLEIAKAYGTLLLCNLVINLALLAIERTDNPNNAAIFSMAGENLSRTAAIAVFLAPLVEEPMFRGGVFNLLRRYNRIAAYGASMLLFAVYHVWSFAAEDPTAWLYVLQYLPAGFLLARVYEKTDSIWTGIFLHMTVNGVSMLLVSALGAYL
jgi:membrane protease YdiL (CAAX protease family)